MRGNIPPLSNTPSWCGAQIKAQGQLTLLIKEIGRVLDSIRKG